MTNVNVVQKKTVQVCKLRNMPTESLIHGPLAGRHSKGVFQCCGDRSQSQAIRESFQVCSSCDEPEAMVEKEVRKILTLRKGRCQWPQHQS